MTAFKCYETILLNYQEFFKFEVDNMQLDISTSDIGIDNDKVLISYTTIISAVLSGIETEKDPRNLVVTFELMRLVLHMFGNSEKSLKTIEPFLEEIFENISCYYPIEFEPPKDDKFRITPKDLKDGLNKCIVASPLLADMSFPFILDKLASANTLAKSESVNTLKVMMLEYPIQKVREF